MNYSPSKVIEQGETNGKIIDDSLSNMEISPEINLCLTWEGFTKDEFLILYHSF